jgi:ribosomal protein L33
MNNSESPEKFPLKLFMIIDSTNKDPETRVFLELKKFDNPDTKETFKAEKFVLIEKFSRLRLKVDERVPIHSRENDYKWFVIMDTFGFIYLMMINHLDFSEKLLFSMLDKVKNKMRDNKDIFFKNKKSNPEKLEPIKESIFAVLNTYNDTIANGENPEEVYSDPGVQYSVMSVSERSSFDKNTLPMEEDENLHHIKSNPPLCNP